MATPVRVRINCKTPSTGISTPSLKVNSPFPRSVQSTRVATLPVNDDVAEKKRRRLEAAASVASPTIGTPVKRKDTDSGNQWTNAQIAEHYSQCIKLSSENKINAKNAFGLHLIDHMAQMLRSKGNMTNFQVAGCTLDAGAKIYAGRVDAIYNDVFKMLGGFGRANKPEKGKESDDDEQPEGEPKRVRGKKHHTNGFSSQIVKDVTTINTNNYDLEFEVDPLFKKMSAAFDEGGAAGLLINQLRLDSDHCQLMMDASSKIIDDVAPIPSIPINVSSLKKYIVDMATAKICPTLAGFSLSSDGQQDEWNTSALLSSTKKPPTSTHFTADGEPLQLNYSSDDGDDGFANIGSAPEHFNDEFPVMNDHTDVFSDNFTATNTQSHQPLATEQQPATRPELLEWSEYSYFSQAAVEAWAGPQHWKLRSRLKPQDSNEENIAEKPTTKRQPRKAFSIDFSVPLLADVFVQVKITSRKLSKVQIKKTKVTDTTLPHNECIFEKRFLQPFTRPECIVKRRERRNNVEDEVDAEPLYNYDNVVDQENYCPMITETGEGGNSDDDDDRNTVENYSGNDTALMPFVNNTQQIMLNDTCDVSTRMLNLVAAPNKIEQIKVNFARQAKRINMQKLKSSMWNIITEKQPSRTSEDQENTYAVKQTEVLFSQLYVKLPSLLSQAMAKEVSIPIAFVSLLHLANEKNLSIINSTDDLAVFTHVTS